MFLPTALKGVTVPKMNYSLYSRLGLWSAWKNRRGINILKMRLGAFRRPFEHGRRGHQNFRRALLMKMSLFPLTGISSFSALCVAQPKLLVGLPLRVKGLLKLGENWKVGKDGDRVALLEQAAGDGHSPSWFPLNVTFFGGEWCLAALLMFLLPSFPKRKCMDHLCALGVSLPVRGSWDCSSSTTLCCSGSCIKGHCCCLHDVQGK